MNRRLLGIILISTFLVLSISGLLMYFLPFAKNMASLHTFFALIFIVWIILHVINNKTPLFRYIKGANNKGISKFLAIAVAAILSVFAVGLYLDTPYLNRIYNFGNEFRNSQVGKTQETLDYEIIDLTDKNGNQKLSIELKKGNAFKYPLFAVWAEDKQGNYIETLYISRVISSSTFDYGKKVGDNWEAAIVRRPESIPYWAHKRGVIAEDGLYMPLNGAPDLDTVTGATPATNFIVNSKSSIQNHKSYNIMLEVNQSFDWNDFYTKTTFPADKIYSGSGQVGQPSLIYQAEINPSQKNYFMNLIGHGHYSGKDGKLYTDLSSITTAKNIAERIIVTINN